MLLVIGMIIGGLLTSSPSSLIVILFIIGIVGIVGFYIVIVLAKWHKAKKKKTPIVVS